ncbi:uncharacterized protein METZ01_LOCUS494058, partial [marine metagenome]
GPTRRLRAPDRTRRHPHRATRLRSHRGYHPGPAPRCLCASQKRTPGAACLWYRRIAGRLGTMGLRARRPAHRIHARPLAPGAKPNPPGHTIQRRPTAPKRRTGARCRTRRGRSRAIPDRL